LVGKKCPEEDEMKKQFVALCAAILLFAGCGTDQQPSGITIVDDLQTSVTLAATPQRIVSLTPNTTEIVYYIGLGKELVGRSNYCNYPPEVSNVVSVGDPMSLSIEKIIELKPDLVVANRMIPIEIIEKLRSLGLTVAAFDPLSVDGVIDTINRMSMLCQVPTNTDQLIADLVTYKKPLGDKTVYIEIWNEPPTTFGKNTFGSDLVKWVGAINLGDQLEGAYPTTTDEALLKLNPTVVVIPTKNRESVDKFKSRKGFDALEAVKNNKVFAIDEDIISRPGPRIIDAIKELSTFVNP
jgi:iron complex transport system substrate-binding protein